MYRFIRVRTEWEGLHSWPAAPATEAYLRNLHRHLFTVDMEIEVGHYDREIEFNQLKRWLDTQIATMPTESPRREEEAPNFGSTSCEMFTERLVQLVAGKYGAWRRIRCVVWEDGLLGGGIEVEPHGDV